MTIKNFTDDDDVTNPRFSGDCERIATQQLLKLAVWHDAVQFEVDDVGQVECGVRAHPAVVKRRNEFVGERAVCNQNAIGQ